MDTHQITGKMPTENELVAFQHGAAGHQGLSSNAAGDLIIKPCVQAEIDFYEAAKEHPEFQAHMPTYIGKLELGTGEAVQEMAPTMAQGVSSPAIVTNPAITEAQAGGASQATDATEKPAGWVPSGGKKLETGLALVLENATAGFIKPNVLDLKLGARLWDDEAPEAKRQKLDEVAASTTSGSLGFRIAGMKVWLGSAAGSAPIELHTTITDGYKSYDKNYGRNLDEHTVEQAIAHYFAGSVLPLTYGRDKTYLHDKIYDVLAKRFLKELESIQIALEHEESRMYSASILVVTEGDLQALEVALEKEAEIERGLVEATAKGGDDSDGDDDDDDEEDLGPRIIEVRLIDFAHAAFTPGQGPDENALKGVRNIIAAVKEVCN